MASNYPLAIKSIYNFTLKAGSILGAGFKSATVLGLLDFDSAVQIEDVTPIHATILSQLGAGVPKDPRALIYVKLKTSSGLVRVIAMDWIASPPELVVSQTVNIVLSEVNLSDLGRLAQVLKANGWPKMDITVLNEPQV